MGKSKSKGSDVSQRARVDTSVPAHDGERYWDVAMLIFSFVLLVYIPTRGFDFVSWDDLDYIRDNPRIRSLSWASIVEMFTSFDAGSWVPLTFLTHALVYHFAKLNPAPYHFINVVFHALNAVLVFYLALRILILGCAGKDRAPEKFYLYVAVLTALLFGVHPIHVESVAWITERKDLVNGFFFLLSLIAYLDYHASGATSRAKYAMVMGFFVLSLLAKPMSVTLPLVLLILDFWPLRRFTRASQATPISFHWVLSHRSLVLEKMPFFFISILFGLVAIKAAHEAKAMEVSATLLFRLMNAFNSIVFYLQKLIVPTGLTPLYPFPRQHAVGAGHMVSLILFLCVSLMCYRDKERPGLWAAWMFYLVMLGPVLGILQVGGHAAADRYTYLPTLSIMFLIAYSLVALYYKARLAKSLIGNLMVPVYLLIVILLSYASTQQMGVWKNSTSLWETVIARFPDQSVVAHVNMGNAYLDDNKLGLALDHYRRAIAINYNRAIPHNNVGNVLLRKGMFREAIVEYLLAIDLDPSYDSYRNIWFAYDQLGMDKEALSAIQKSVELDPRYTPLYARLGISAVKNSLFPEAEKAFLKALSQAPESIMAHENLVKFYADRGKLSLATEHCQQAMRLGGCKDQRLSEQAYNVKEKVSAGQ